MNYAFLNADGIVVNVITGALTDKQLSQFLSDYATLFGATQVVAVDAATAVWIGGSYTEGVFAPPPPPEIVESIAELIAEPAPLEPEL
jgi:hypothetical protein